MAHRQADRAGHEPSQSPLSRPFGDHPLRGTPEHRAPLSRAEKLATFLAYVQVISEAGLSPGFARITKDDEGGLEITLALPNFMARNAIHAIPDSMVQAEACIAHDPPPEQHGDK